MASKHDIDLPVRNHRTRDGLNSDFYMVQAICRTVDCPVNGIPFQARLRPNPDNIERVLCGRCREWIEDITDV